MNKSKDKQPKPSHWTKTPEKKNKDVWVKAPEGKDYWTLVEDGPDYWKITESE